MILSCSPFHFLLYIYSPLVTSSRPVISATIYMLTTPKSVSLVRICIWITRFYFKCLFGFFIQVFNRNFKHNITKPEFLIFFLPTLLLLQLSSVNLNNLKLKIQELSLILFSPLPFSFPLLPSAILACYIFTTEITLRLSINDSHLYI